ncbi:MAG: PepSY-like domain-containing protein [Bacteroidales bacterium]|nr:PepSY-like domain-containing protein [Bacteroidales bacterium]
MKNLLLSLVVIVAMTSCCRDKDDKCKDKKIDEKNLPANVKAKFAAAFPDATKVEWVKEEGNYEAEFESGSKEMTVEIDSTGNIVKTETEVEEKDVPAAVRSKFVLLHPDAEEVEWALVDGKYEAEFEEEESAAFDATGNVIEKKCNKEEVGEENEEAGEGAEAENVEPPANIKAKFKEMFPKAEVKNIVKEGENIEYEFEVNDSPMTVEFDLKGNVIETETAVQSSTLPKVILDYISKDAKGAKIKEPVAKAVTNKGETLYEIKAGNMEYVFDVSGKFIKKHEVKEAKKEKGFPI